jgi:hypothetical protein
MGTAAGICDQISRRLGWRRLLFTALAMLALQVVAAQAQISPGPLARAHQSLNGTSNCASCHKLASGQATFKCLDCHMEVSKRLAEGKGLHATYHLSPGSSQECVRCHSEHNGEDLPLIKWDPKTFDHRQTGYALEGKHAGVTCNRCHTAQHISAAMRPLIKIRDLNRSFLGVATDCVGCHQDQHNGRLGTNCQQCHNTAEWKNVSQFDHAKTRYPLTGMHAQVTCAKCHTPGPDNKPRFAGLPFGKCSDCHRDPHKGSFTQACQSCHNTGGWKKVSVAAISERFDHSKTKYPLLGKHAEVQCSQCHANGDFKKTLAFEKCSDCHRPSPHGTQFSKRADAGECSSCHNLQGFKPSTYGLKEHATSAYPLEGKHAAVQCAQCHIPKGKDTLFKIEFQRCTDCHSDQHAGQFASAPYFNGCERCHNLQGYKPSTFGLARHKETRFLLTGGHVAVPCSECHKAADTLAPKPVAAYRWDNLTCVTCHSDPHKGQFKDRMQKLGPGGKPVGCEGCHTTKAWRELSGFDHASTSFPLVGAHRATACIDCHKPPNMETRLLNVDFKTAPNKCEECHEDIHGKQFAKSGVTPCAECHNSAKWKPSLFDHDKRTAFSLQGAHRNVRCEACHKASRVVESKTVLFYKPTPKECAACHGPGPVPSKPHS